MNQNFEDLRPAAANMLKSNMGLQDGERVAFVTDVPSPSDWQRRPYDQLAPVVQLAAMTKRLAEMMAEDFPSNPVDFICYPMTGQHGTEPPQEMAQKMQEYDVLILMTSYSLTHTNARADANQKGARIASMPGVEAVMFAPGGPIAADCQAIAVETLEWARILTRGSQVHITTPYGTDLSFSIAGRAGDSDTGLIHQKGTFSNLPGGEAFIVPIEGTAEGKLVALKNWYPALKEDMTIVFKEGYATALLGGGEVGDAFRALLAFGDESKKHRRNCAELGIGTNPNAKRPENVLEAEKIRGTVHVALGDNAHMGGVNASDLHDDFVQSQPTVWIDGEIVIG